jgi:hypothetical protein
VYLITYALAFHDPASSLCATRADSEKRVVSPPSLGSSSPKSGITPDATARSGTWSEEFHLLE